MTDAAPTSSAPDEPVGAREPGWLRAACVLAFLALLGVSAVWGGFRLFETFVANDDEGYVLITIRQFLAGQPLYESVETQYGPGFYAVSGLLFGPLRLPLDHESVRWLTLVCWLGSALLCAAAALRATGSALLAALSFGLVARTLEALRYEPWHPQVLLALLLAGIALLVAHGLEGPRRRARCVGLGLLLALIATTKINLGVFALAALGVAFLDLTRGRAARVLRVVLGLGLLALPLALLRGVLAHERGPLVLGFFLTVIAPVAVGTAPLPDEERRLELRDWAWPFLGLAAGMALCGGVALATGTSPRGLVWGVVLQHLDFHERLLLLLALPSKAPLSLGLGGLGFLLWRWGLARSSGPGARLPADALGLLLKVAFVGVILAARGRYLILCAYAAPLAWVVAIPGAPDAPGRFARAALAALPSASILFVFPIAGAHQVAVATFLLQLSAAVCARDLLLAAAARWPRAAALRPWRPVATLSLLLGLLGWGLASARSARRDYAAAIPLDLPGASRLRIDEERAAAFAWAARNLRRHTDAFVTLPGLASFYLWAEQRSPAPYNRTNWHDALPAPRQQRVLDVLTRSPRACVLLGRELSVDLSRHLSPRALEGPLVRAIREEFRPVGRAGPLTLLVRRERPPLDLVHCARIEPGDPTKLGVLLEPLPRGPLARVELVGGAGEVLAPSAVEVWEPARWAARDLAAAPLPLEGGARLRLRAPQRALRLRLRDPAGRWIAVLPVLDESTDRIAPRSLVPRPGG